MNNNTQTQKRYESQLCAFEFDGSKISSITIPKTITRISNLAFGYCRNLTDIHYEGTKAEWNLINLGYGWNGGCGAITVHCTDGDIAIASAN